MRVQFLAILFLSMLAATSESSAQVLTCNDLNGAYVYSQESPARYLGFFGTATATDSIMNRSGQFGSDSQMNSVRNTSGPYGSSTGTFSAGNQFTGTPPWILRGPTQNAELIAYLSTNTAITGHVSLQEIDSVCVQFTATSPNFTTPPAPPFVRFQPALAGTYLDPARGGEGWLINFGDSNGQPTFVATWFTYSNRQQMYLIGNASYSQSTTDVTMGLSRTSGALFGAQFVSSDVVTTPWGTARFRWENCDRLVMTYTENGGQTGTITYGRLISRPAGTVCQQ